MTPIETLALQIAIGWVAYSFLSLWPCFYYLFNIRADITERKVPPTAFYLLVLVNGYLVDYTVNILASFVFLQIPNINRLTLSARMDDLIVNGFGWRQKLAIKIVGRLLEPYDLTKQHVTYGKYHA